MVLWSPVWLIALGFAVCAPWFVRALADGFERRVRKRTEALVERALAKSERRDGDDDVEVPAARERAHEG